MRKMKNSGYQWMGEIPTEWGVSKVGNFFYFSSGDTLTSESILNEGKYLVYGANGVRGYYNTSNLSGKHILLGRVGALCGNVHIVEGDIWVTEHALVAHTKSKVCEEYYGYIFEAMNLLQYSKASAQPVISSDTISNLRFPVPTLAEQKKIADFLDRTCSEIDAVIAKTKATIEEYKALKQSIITETVTKGIRGDRAMKDSGNVWYGEIPVDWNICKVKYVFRIKKDIAGKEGYTILSITQRGILPKNISKNEGQLAENYSNYQLVEPGDFAMNHMDLLTGWVDISQYSGVTSPDYRVFVLLDKISNFSQYYLHLMKMCYTNRIFYGLGQGVSGMGRWRLQADKFLNFTVPVPSYEEQKEIADYLDKKCAEIDTLIAKKTALLEEMESYKKSVIYEYVTGKKEVK